MATVNEELMDREVSHAIYLQRYSSGVVNRMIAILNQVDADLAAQISAALEGESSTETSMRRLDQLLASVQELNAAAYRKVSDQLQIELQSFAGYESGFQRAAIVAVLPQIVAEVVIVNAVSGPQVYAAAMARPFQGRLLSEVLSGIEGDRAERIRNAIRMGFVEGETISQMVRRIRGTKAQNYADGLLETDRRSAEAVVRTAVNHTANVARQAIYEANSDLIKEWQFLATLDSRTTITCASLSGKKFKIGTGPQPPRHWRCRSTSVPVLVSAWEALGVRKSDIPPSIQASMDGYVAGNLTYSQWLRRKPAAFQDDLLGETRGKLFRDGKVDIDRFTDAKGSVYTLDELRQRDGELFKRAGL